MAKITCTLRTAIQSDAKRLAELWSVTFADKFGPILGDQAESVLYDWFKLSDRHLQTTVLAELDGVVAGFMVLETPNSPDPDDGRWLWRALQLHNGIIGALRGLILLALIDNDHKPRSDEVYIEMLGVDPAWQSKGVARTLLQHAIDVATLEDVASLTLHVVDDNIPAINLYKKIGFTVKSKQRSRVLQWVTGHRGYYEMSKVIAASLENG